MRGGSVNSARHPLAKRAIRAVPLGCYSNKTLHRTRAHFHRSYVRLAKDKRLPLRINTDQETPLSTDRTAHAALHHEAQPAHKLFLDNIGASREDAAHTLGRLCIIRYRVPLRPAII